MNKLRCFYLLCSVLFIASCSSEIEEVNDSIELSSDSVEINFNFSGVDVTETPMSRTKVNNPKTYYNIIVEYPYPNIWDYNLGHVGTFDDLKHAKLKVKRGTQANIYATAIIESETTIDFKDITVLKKQDDMYERPATDLDVYNHFTDYLAEEGPGGYRYSGNAICPVYEDQSIDRYYKMQEVVVNSNETINIKLDRFSYKLGFEIDAPNDGYVVLSCTAPELNFKVDCNDKHFSKTSTLYSIGGTDLAKAAKNITLKIEHFNASGVSKKVETKDVMVKPNVETIVNVNFSEIDAKNGFNLTLDTTPMSKEEISWN